MKKVIFLFFLCISLAANGYSQTKQESIKELIHIMKNDSMINKMIDGMIPAMVNQMQMKDSTAKARSMEIAKMAMESAKEALPKMMDQMTASYDRYFTEQDIKDFITYYKSPAGQKYISVMPEMMKDIMGNMMKNFIPEMKKSMEAKMEALKKKERK